MQLPEHSFHKAHLQNIFSATPVTVMSTLWIHLKKLPFRRKFYGDIAEHHHKELPNIKIGEIIDVNLNSCQAIKLVLENLCKKGGVSSTRKWIRIGFDRVPYRIASNLCK